MRVFKAKAFSRFARKEQITDATLCQTVQSALEGQVDADYGGNVIKQRIARPNAGKSGGYRVILCLRNADRAFFVYGYAKSDQSNIDDSEVAVYKQLATTLLGFSEVNLDLLVKSGKFKEITCNESSP